MDKELILLGIRLEKFKNYIKDTREGLDYDVRYQVTDLEKMNHAQKQTMISMIFDEFHEIFNDYFVENHD